MIPADVTVAARRMDDAGRLSCVLRSHPARAPMSAPACTLSSAVQRATVNLQPLAPLAAAAAPGTGAAALRPYIAPRLVPLAAAAAPGTGAAALRPTLPLASRPSPPPLPPVQAQRRCAPTRCRPPFNVQRSTFNLSRPYSSLVTFSFLLVVCFPLAVMRMSLYNES